MIRRALAPAFFVALAVAAVVQAANLPDRWRSWQFSRAIQISDAAGASKFSLPTQIYSHMQWAFGDLRIVDESGREIPYLVYNHDVHGQTEARSAAIRENSFVPGQYTQLVIDLGEKTAFHNAMEIRTTQTDFIDWVEIAASDDAKANSWRIVKDRAPISNFSKENIAGSRTVRYSDNNARFLRVRIFETARQFPVTSVAVLFSQEFHEPSREQFPAHFTPDATAQPTVTRWTADLGAGAFPISGVQIDTTQPEFFRIVHLQTSDDGHEWLDYFSGEIYRYQQGGKQAESLRVHAYEGWNRRYWRIEIVNGNDAPLADAKPALLTIPYFVLFYPQPGHSYQLLYGNIAAKEVHYDLSRTFDYHTEPSAKIATLGDQQVATNYRDPHPFSERHPEVLWIALIAAVILLGYAAFRALREPHEVKNC